MKVRIQTECPGCSGDVETTLDKDGKFALAECEFCDEKISVTGFVKIGKKESEGEG